MKKRKKMSEFPPISNETVLRQWISELVNFLKVVFLSVWCEKRSVLRKRKVINRTQHRLHFLGLTWKFFQCNEVKIEYFMLTPCTFIFLKLIFFTNNVPPQNRTCTQTTLSTFYFFSRRNAVSQPGLSWRLLEKSNLLPAPLLSPVQLLHKARELYRSV